MSALGAARSRVCYPVITVCGVVQDHYEGLGKDNLPIRRGGKHEEAKGGKLLQVLPRYGSNCLPIRDVNKVGRNAIKPVAVNVRVAGNPILH